NWQDEAAAEALNRSTPVSAVGMSGAMGASVGGTATFDAAVAADPPMPPDVLAGLIELEHVAQALLAGDQGASFDWLVIQWKGYANWLQTEARDRLFRDFEKWQGDTADKVQDYLEANRRWLDTVTESCLTVSRQAQSVVDAFRGLRKEHVKGEDPWNNGR